VKIGKPLKILHVASEIAPFSKTGGLGDVLGALPSAQSRLGDEVAVVTPLYKTIDRSAHGLVRWLRRISVPLGDDVVEVGLWEGRPPRGSDVRLYFIEHEPSFGRDGLYGDAHGEFGDNARRFVLLGRAALVLAAHLERWPDVVHAHDWQAGPALIYADGTEGLPRPKRVLTIHNLAYRGLFPPTIVDELGLPRAMFSPAGFEFWGQVSFLKAGIVLADRITTVSPRYATEMREPDAGWGLDGLLRARGKAVSGILNGVDYDLWNPERDLALATQYSSAELAGKRPCKTALQHELGLPLRPDTPLSGSVTRLTEQKGIDLLVAALPRMLEEDHQMIILGSGDGGLASQLTELGRRFPKKLAVRLGYDDGLAHRVQAGADLFVMPSRFEPCGLAQLYALRYGTPPVVRAVGGLYDTVVDYEPRSQTGTGFVFGPLDVDALCHAWQRALFAYRGPAAEWLGLMRRGMAQDFSWATAASRYRELYLQANAER